MYKFSDTLEKYLELRDDLKDEELNFNSIPDRSFARMELAGLKSQLDEYFEQMEIKSYE